jgi:hypothetical protein
MTKILSIICLVLAILSFLTFFISIGIRQYNIKKCDNAPNTMGDIIRFHFCPCLLFIAAYLAFNGM